MSDGPQAHTDLEGDAILTNNVGGDIRAGSLSGIRVIDATQMLAGPLAGTRLGDLGAEVIKIEPPSAGEFNRTHGLADARVDGEMTTFAAVNRNKQSLSIDLKHDGSAQVMRDLVARSDVFIHNFRHGTPARLGIDYDNLRAMNPRLVYCSISGYGSVGGYRDRPGQDLILQGYSGSMFAVGAADDPPQPGPLFAVDAMTGYQAVIGVLAALRARDVTGRGQHVEVDMLSVVLDAQLQEIVTFLNAGVSPERTAERSAHASLPAPYGVFKTADGWLTIAMSPLNALGEVVDSDWLRGLTDYNDGHRHRDMVFRHIKDAFSDRTTAEWIELCDRVGVWSGPVYDYAMLADDPHIQSAGVFVDQPSHVPGKVVRTVRPPLRLSETPASIRSGAPTLGGDTRAVLRGLGYDSAKIEELLAAGVVRAG